MYAPPPGHGAARHVLSRATAQDTGEMARYYADLLRQMARHAKRPSGQRHHFEVHPMLFAPDGFEIRYVAGSTWDDALLTLERLQYPRDGLLDDLIEECWEVEMIGVGGRS